MALFVLPSSLRLPQANPATTLELAPVPPVEADQRPPPAGNVASFGLAETVTAAGGVDGAGAGAGAGVSGGEGDGSRAIERARTAGTKRCVGRPPRQTEDPLSPPCVADFEGVNGGATYLGVTADEVRVVLYKDVFPHIGGPQVYYETPTDTIVDVDQEPQADDMSVLVAARVLQQYFNARYQTYGRRVHLFLQFGRGSISAASRQADAAKAYAEVRPFAVVDLTTKGGHQAFYVEYLAAKGVLSFGSWRGAHSEEFFRRFPKLLWSFAPTVEHLARQYAEFVCTKVASHPVSFAGTIPAGTTRRYGLIASTDPAFPGLQRQARLVKELVRQDCGVEMAAEASHPKQLTYTGGGAAGYAVDAMLRFREAGVTTVLWPAGTDLRFSESARNVGYQPEWILGGDGLQETNLIGQDQDQATWAHAFVVTSVMKTPIVRQLTCYQAFREFDAADEDAEALYGCSMYEHLRQLFTGVQVAGPKLGPFSVDKGFRAIPAVASSDPLVPACFYRPGEYTCVKDAIIEWWDPSGTPESILGTGPVGCWKMIRQGQRYLEGQFPAGNVDAQKDPAADPCNNYTSYLSLP